MAEDKNLYRPFFRVRSEEKEVGDELKQVRVNYFGEEIKYQPRLSDVLKQGRNHYTRELEQAIYDRLTNEERRYFDEVRLYIKLRNNVIDFVSWLKKEEKGDGKNIRVSG